MPKTEGRRPVLTIEPSIRVRLDTHREGDESLTMHVDDGSISDFLEWQRKNNIYSFRGGASGPGFYSADFPAEYADAIRDYFRSVGLPNAAE